MALKTPGAACSLDLCTSGTIFQHHNIFADLCFVKSEASVPPIAGVRLNSSHEWKAIVYLTSVKVLKELLQD